MELTKHPAKFTDAILDRANEMLNFMRVPRNSIIPPILYDPFAGTGKGVDYFQATGEFCTFGTELEREWAEQSGRVIVADALAYMREHPASVDIVFTSPAYGNRMADHHDAKDTSKRNTYRHKLGRPLSAGSSAALQWGEEYRRFHLDAWSLVASMLRPGGYFLLNVKDHIRKGDEQDVPKWHYATCVNLGFLPVETVQVPVRGNGFGQNRDARVEYELLFLFRTEN